MRQGAHRAGLLTPVPGVGLAIGDTSAYNALFTPDGVEYRCAEQVSLAHQWDQIETIRLNAEETGWPHPWIGDIVVPLMVGVLGDVVTLPEAKQLALEVTHAGQADAWTLSAHYAVGYRARDLRRARTLLGLLVNSPDARAHLQRPEAVLQSIRAGG